LSSWTTVQMMNSKSFPVVPFVSPVGRLYFSHKSTKFPLF
jgi:hypothetical protein